MLRSLKIWGNDTLRTSNLKEKKFPFTWSLEEINTPLALFILVMKYSKFL